MSDPRLELERAARARGVDFITLSRLIGRNPAYIQQFVKRGSPRKLDEEDRAIIARYLGMDESLLGAPERMAEERSAPASPVTLVPRLDVGASAGPGALAGEEAAAGLIGFDARWLRQLGADARHLSMIRVQGESMVPTLADGDDILVDRADGSDRVRDGIYVLRVDDSLIVKRLALNPATRTFRIRSDNPDYPDWDDCPADAVNIIGRVIWAGRKLR